MVEFTIRTARLEDAKALSEIYAPYVKDTCISFEETPPTAQQFEERIAATLKSYPYLVCEAPDGKIIGYAYASRHGERAAYKYSANVSVYVDKSCLKNGAGRALYERLFQILRDIPVYTVFASVSSDNPESEAFHLAMGFKEVGRFKKVGFKFGRWIDLIWLELPLRSYD